uniref:Uncharacterized protein n=1 Tax=Oryza nivara TaxID=4536 RepID=A0A0E0I310_ORYNI
METGGMINMPCLDGLISNKNRSETDAYVFLKLLASSSGGNNIMGPHDSPARCVEYSYSPTCRYGTFATGGCDSFMAFGMALTKALKYPCNITSCLSARMAICFAVASRCTFDKPKPEDEDISGSLSA